MAERKERRETRKTMKQHPEELLKDGKLNINVGKLSNSASESSIAKNKKQSNEEDIQEENEEENEKIKVLEDKLDEMQKELDEA